MFLEEEDLHFYVLIDNSRSMSFGEPTVALCRAALLHRWGLLALRAPIVSGSKRLVSRWD